MVLRTILNTEQKCIQSSGFLYGRTLFLKPEKLSWMKFAAEVWP